MEISNHGQGGTGFKATEIGLDSFFTTPGLETMDNMAISSDSLLRN